MGTASSKLMCATGINSLRGLQQVRRLHVGNLRGRVWTWLATGNPENSSAPFRFAKDDLEERVTLPSPSHSSVFWGPPSCALTTQDLRRGIAESIGTRRRGRSFSHGLGCCFLSARENARVRHRERTGYCQCKLKNSWHVGEKKLP
jgi:hypothetical protein